jgi:DNA topoisomerase-1
MKNLVIVESPAKAKTIEKFLGADFTVVSCKGHIRDLADGNDAIDIKNGFKPKYEISPDKIQLVTQLKGMVKKAETVWLATDEDREGEAISWHLFEVLNLQKMDTKRIVFNEITKPAIQKAVQNPRTIDNHLVDAQQARRVLDRIVGYSLSSTLWQNIRQAQRNRLSGGRVQSVAVRLVVEREREINAFNSQSDFKISADFITANGKLLKAELDKKCKTVEEAKAVLTELMGATYSVDNIEVKPAYRNPAPPFTTSTLQQEASRKLGYDVSRTMQIAQKLYENGFISYMRTDSVNLSQTAIEGAKNEILNEYGSPFSNPRNFSTKSDNAQEAHEAIRPTYFNNHSAGTTPQEKKLYELIWKRAIASQMSRAELEKTIISITNSNNALKFKAEGEVLKFEGFLKVYLESTDDEESDETAGMLPAVKVGEELKNKEVLASQKFTKHAPRYTEASLVKKLEELGIGRPSTYAPTIQTIQKRGYIQSESRPAFKRDVIQLHLSNNAITESKISENFGAEKNKLFPTDIGMIVTDFLSSKFNNILDYGFTAAVEKEFDEIAHGLKGWQKMLEEFYGPFQTTLDQVNQTSNIISGERELGKDPLTGLTVIARMGQYGPIVQLGTREETETPDFAGLLPTQRLETITLKDGLKLIALFNQELTYRELPVKVGNGKYGVYVKWGDRYINLPTDFDLMSMDTENLFHMIEEQSGQKAFPFELGMYGDEKLIVGKGMYGPYVRYKNTFVSIPKAEDPLNISLDRAIELVQKKLEDDLKKILRTFTENADVTVQTGRYGPFIKFGKENLKIPTGVSIEELTYDQILEIQSKSAPTKKNSSGKKSAASAEAKPKTAAKKATKPKAAAKKSSTKK